MTTQGNVAAATATLKPGVISAYGHGWNKLWPQFGILLLIWIILAAISAGGGYIPYVGFLVGLFLSGPLNYGVNYAYLKATRGEKAEVQDMFTVFNQYWNVFLANLLVMIIVIVGFILLIVPGIYLSCKLAIVSYLVVDKKMQVTDALKASWNMTKWPWLEGLSHRVIGYTHLYRRCDLPWCGHYYLYDVVQYGYGFTVSRGKLGERCTGNAGARSPASASGKLIR
jgi:uncharacterized membrane protein